MSYYEMGYFLVVANISDIAAMGAKPMGVVLCYGLPEDFKIKEVKELTYGAKKAAIDHKVVILGGDTGWVSSPRCLIGAAIGKVSKDKILRRDKAKKGDLIFVTGTIGLFSTALIYFLLARKKGLKLTPYEERILRYKLIKPKARIREGVLLANAGYCTSCMDITDGFSVSINELMESSNVGFEIYKSKLPISDLTIKVANFLNLDYVDLAFAAGADFELIGTIDEELYFSSPRKYQFVKIIGKVCSKSKKFLIDDEGEKREILPIGWEHFKGSAVDTILNQFKFKQDRKR